MGILQIILFVFFVAITEAITIDKSSTFYFKRSSRSTGEDVRDDYAQRLGVTSPFEAGDWGKVEMCPAGQFVSGVAVEYQPYKGSAGSAGHVWGGIFSLGIWNAVAGLSREWDDNGLTGVLLYCKSKPTDKSTVMISSLTNENTDRTYYKHSDTIKTHPKFCKQSFATGFSVSMQPSQGTPDDAGITNFGLQCKDGGKLKHALAYDPGEGNEESKSCPVGTAICGLLTKVEYGHHDDNTGLNDIIIYCCVLPNKLEEDVENCEPQQEWKIVTKYENGGRTPTTHQFQIRVGLSSTKENRNVGRTSSTNSFEHGYSQEFSVSQIGLTLAAKFNQKFGESTTLGKENEYKTGESYETEHTISQTVEVGPMKILKVFQKIQSCGPFRIGTVHTKRVDECVKEQEKICEEYNDANKFGGGGGGK